jgi:glycine cleavage system H protein
MYPTDRSYSKDHEWIAVEGDQVVVGITEFAQKELGDIVYVELPKIGAEVKAGDVLGTIESVKAVSEIFAPLTGRVVAANESLDDKPETANLDPHGEGWYCKLQLADRSELASLMDAEAYVELIGG